jgi:DNA-binding NarL/FixJ family response regulator
MEKIKIMIAEDHKMFREAILTRISEASSRISIIGAAENGVELLEALKIDAPDIILLDLIMPEMDGWKVLQILKTDFPHVKAIIFSGEFEPAHVSHAILAGAAAFIDKWKGDERDIIAAIESVYDFGYYFNDKVSQEIIVALKKQKQIPPLLEDQYFSDREREIIDMICEGKQIKEIAVSLNLSQGTVKFHKGNIYKKTESNTNLDLLKYAISQGVYNVFQTKPRKKG